MEKECAWHLCHKSVQRKFCSPQCKNKFYVDRRRKTLKRQAVDHLGGQCLICGYSRSIKALVFHHKDPNLKDFGLSQRGHTRSWTRVKKELNKCVLLCSNCHVEVHEGIVDCPD